MSHPADSAQWAGMEEIGLWGGEPVSKSHMALHSFYHFLPCPHGGIFTGYLQILTFQPLSSLVLCVHLPGAPRCSYLLIPLASSLQDPSVLPSLLRVAIGYVCSPTLFLLVAVHGPCAVLGAAGSNQGALEVCVSVHRTL